MANRPNYPKMMEQVLLSLGDSRPRLLLHACCAPCSSAVLEMLCGFFDITILYYNPNIWPASEYRRRADELHQFVKQAKLPGITLVEEGYDQSEFYTAVAGLEAEPERGRPLHRVLSAADGARGPVRRRKRIRLVLLHPFDQPPQGRGEDQRHRPGAGSKIRRAPPA